MCYSQLYNKIREYVEGSTIFLVQFVLGFHFCRPYVMRRDPESRHSAPKRPREFRQWMKVRVVDVPVGDEERKTCQKSRCDGKRRQPYFSNGQKCHLC
jgi:hypothetical protein